MPWSVRLQDERGNQVIDSDAVIEFEVPSDDAAGLLRYVNPYGDTYFNQLQMTDFLSEWQKIRPVNDNRQFQAWEKVLAMAKICKEEPHRYLVFIGD